MAKNETIAKRKNESGVALITVIMISFLLMIACASILWAVGANSKNATDVLAETKAFYAAESGMQATLNVLRGHVPPSPLIDSGQAATAPVNQIDYIKAVDPESSNIAAESGIAARLSRWMTYNYPMTGTPDRVVIGESPGTYRPNTGTAYSVTVTDPDYTRERTVYSTVGKFQTAGVASVVFQAAVADPANTTTLTYVPATSIPIDHPATDPGWANANLGSFKLTQAGTGGIIAETAFQINYGLGSPRSAVRSIRGKITSVGGVWKLKIDAVEYSLMGSSIDLCLASDCTVNQIPAAPYLVTLQVPTTDGQSQTTPVYALISPCEPYRLILKTTGYGPNGAKKQLEAIIQRNIFNDLSGGAAVSMLGPNPGFLWEPGNSNNVSYSGNDPNDPGVSVPSIGVTNQASLDYILAHPPGNDPSQYQPPPAVISDELPEWQQSAAAMNDYITQLRSTAQDATRYYNVAGGATAPSTVGYVENGIGKGITFVDGNFSFGGGGGGQTGGGILVVTGKLTLTGTFSFTGLIIVTGTEGVLRTGGGNGTIIGNMIIAPYDPNNLNTGFLPPKYKINGGGISHIIYSGSTTESFQGTSAVSDLIRGVAEK